MVRVSQAGSIAGIKKGIEICKKELSESGIFVGIWKILLEAGKYRWKLEKTCWKLDFF